MVQGLMEAKSSRPPPACPPYTHLPLQHALLMLHLLLEGAPLSRELLPALLHLDAQELHLGGG